jgi:hypothetical protein
LDFIRRPAGGGAAPKTDVPRSVGRNATGNFLFFFLERSLLLRIAKKKRVPQFFSAGQGMRVSRLASEMRSISALPSPFRRKQRRICTRKQEPFEATEEWLYYNPIQGLFGIPLRPFFPLYLSCPPREKYGWGETRRTIA